jgi:hypothetical protein
MKSPLLALLLAAGVPLAAQDPAAPQAGYVNILNLVALREPTRIDFGGFRLNDGGPVAPGEGSGLLAIVPGVHRLTLENPGAKPESASGSVQVEHGRTLAVICFDEVKVFADGSREAKLRYNVLVEADADEGARLSLVSLLPDPLVGVEVGGTPATLVPRQAHRMALTIGEEVAITRQGGLLAEIEVDKPVHYIGFLFANPESGEVELSLILNEKLEYQPPLDPDEDDEP